jgi:hypothetical protein
MAKANLRKNRKKRESAKPDLPGAPENRFRDEGIEFGEDNEAGITVENPSQLDHDKYPESHERGGVEKKDPDNSARV